MPIKKRLASPTHTYHVMTRGNNKAEVFHRTQDYSAYISILKRVKRKFHLNLHHFALMPNHVHLLMGVKDLATLSRAMKAINFRYAMYHRDTYRNVGHIWQGRFKSVPMYSHGQLLTCGIYIEVNPVRGGLVADVARYRWSSHRYYLGEPLSFMTDSPAVAGLGETIDSRIQRYQKLTAAWQSARRKTRRSEVEQGTIRFRQDLLGFANQ